MSSGGSCICRRTARRTQIFFSSCDIILVQDYDLDDDGTPDTLRLAFATPRGWLKDGGRISVQAAPTAFGEVSFVIESRFIQGDDSCGCDVAGSDDVRKRCCLRLRLPAGYVLKSARVEWARCQVDRWADNRSVRHDRQGERRGEGWPMRIVACFLVVVLCGCARQERGDAAAGHRVEGRLLGRCCAASTGRAQLRVFRETPSADAVCRGGFQVLSDCSERTGATVKGRLVSDGSAINALRANRAGGTSRECRFMCESAIVASHSDRTSPADRTALSRGLSADRSLTGWRLCRRSVCRRRRFPGGRWRGHREIRSA